MKKYLTVILAVLLVMSALTGCAGKNNPTKQDNALNTTATDPDTATVSESSNSPSVSNTSAAYEKLITIHSKVQLTSIIYYWITMIFLNYWKRTLT